MILFFDDNTLRDTLRCALLVCFLPCEEKRFNVETDHVLCTFERRRLIVFDRVCRVECTRGDGATCMPFSAHRRYIYLSLTFFIFLDSGLFFGDAMQLDVGTPPSFLT